ncbi:hypothetical protein KIN20_003151 [Parelaphostrongylus tenuis]|uniref:Uncharacterized protein n=1 Tax=Parelaphostrongylus tenuis TaxID=148309 RepID=A0AAD5MHV8_PARTN|nr:hypothetical protein KIN20_003151 [Parelaphostrongylus tenuis]
MGCRLTRTESTELCEHSAKKEECNSVSNGQSILVQRDTTTQADHLRNGYPPNNVSLSKPIGQVASSSQADFFRMLDAKIAHGADLDSENET